METQLLIANIALQNDPRNVVHRGPTNPITLPESLVLRAVHGNSALTEVAELRREDRDHKVELERLSRRYGGIVGEVFPLVAGRAAIPGVDDDIPTVAEVSAGEEARTAARAGARKAPAKSKAKPKPEAAPEPDTAALPAFDELPE